MGAISLPRFTGLDCLNQSLGEVVENILTDLHALKKLIPYRIKAEFFHVRDKILLYVCYFYQSASIEGCQDSNFNKQLVGENSYASQFLDCSILC